MVYRDSDRGRLVSKFVTNTQGTIYAKNFCPVRGDDIEEGDEDGYELEDRKQSSLLLRVDVSEIDEIEIVGDWPDEEGSK